MSGGAKLNGFLVRLDQGGALVFAIFGFHRIAARTILFNGQSKSDQLFWLIAFALPVLLKDIDKTVHYSFKVLF